MVFDKVFDKKYVKYRISYLVAVQKKKEAKCYLDNSRKKMVTNFTHNGIYLSGFGIPINGPISP